MSQNVSQYLLNRIHAEWGVTRIYGYPGDGINGLMGAFHEFGDEDRGRIIKESIKGKLHEFTTR